MSIADFLATIAGFEGIDRKAIEDLACKVEERNIVNERTEEIKEALSDSFSEKDTQSGGQPKSPDARTGKDDSG